MRRVLTGRFDGGKATSGPSFMPPPTAAFGFDRQWALWQESRGKRTLRSGSSQHHIGVGLADEGSPVASH